MRTIPTLPAALLGAALLLTLPGCKQERAEVVPPPPAVLTADAVGHYCGMSLADHAGPKGQILVKGQERPIWLSSVRDTFAFTMLPEEPKEIRAIYVTDVGKSKDPEALDMTAWVEARRAWYVLGSRLRGGMGEAEPFPFAEESAARAFAAANGGEVLRFADMHEDRILTPPAEPAMAKEDHQ
ncbi:nitrous oxide reductase accessory protein NosL [Azospirillum picis]|uniref:Nitrous oxide reductase accessory protein NosL n=1 Tax=Azospirillum picis TaxID=488438 RepID=A0ABU0MN46_9PROT|nr:nitrous oxide reductase accessory protein NosL [Azospirillum picis]MBP2301146.1 nitrous oxide reductase accessory protein NosL [Azospirillum picis]MDQ0534892.1 nitrous oxide reductase accessory protein NosL [Azospirillum picis]